MAEVEADTSRGWLGQEDAFCVRPWRLLKVTLTSRTKVCCDFFTLLPEFDFPSAADFHKEDGMWNHPFMQHMRQTLGLPGEVPWCKLCLTADKRAPEHAEQRKQARADSLTLYNKLDDEAYERRCRGSLKTYTGRLQDFSLRVGPSAEIKPFREDQFYYRRLLRRRGLDRCKRVLMFGCTMPTYAPFLAESCEQFMVADVSPALSKRAMGLCEAFDLPAIPVSVEDGCRLALETGAVDAIWINGAALAAASDPALLHEFARVLVPEGILHVQRAPSIGQFASTLAREPDPAKRSEYEALLAQPAKAANHVRFFVSDTLRAKPSKPIQLET